MRLKRFYLNYVDNRAGIVRSAIVFEKAVIGMAKANPRGFGNKPLEKYEPLSNPDKIVCVCCNKERSNKEYYNSRSKLFYGNGKVSYCKDCLDKMYDEYVKQHIVKGHKEPDRIAMEKICMISDKYYNDKIFDSVVKTREEKPEYSSWTFVQLYMKHANMYQYAMKTYDDTINDNYKPKKNKKSNETDMSGLTDEEKSIVSEATIMFGKGFDEEDYLYLHEQYKDWTTRHECNTKTQEEIFKRLCFVQLGLLKASRKGEPTDKLDATFQKLLETANLQPKQNANDSASDAHTFGTLIDKWENTKPIPEVEEELRDVDGIGRYIDVFFRGHTARMLGVKNALSNLYTRYMSKYTVEKPEYKDDEDNEALFDAIFGRDLDDN